MIDCPMRRRCETEATEDMQRETYEFTPMHTRAAAIPFCDELQSDSSDLVAKNITENNEKRLYSARTKRSKRIVKY